MIFRRTSVDDLAKIFQAMTLNRIASVKLGDGTEIAAMPPSMPQLGLEIPRPSEGTDQDPAGFVDPPWRPAESFSEQQAAMARLFSEQQRDNVPDLKQDQEQRVPIPHPEDPTHPDNPVDDNAVFAPDLRVP